ncbi:CdaR family protein [Salinimicrobium soli]|uniref:CdaR family protein n=1 Tax=Salinimicrobium soli TaxID=1254399 RepID=UPI003AACBB5E
MLKRIKTVTRTRFKRTNFNSFFFFLFFAVVIWIFVQFSKQYNEVVDIPVQYINVPPNKLITKNNPQTVKIRMEENGFKVAWMSLFPPTLYVDVSKTSEEGGKLIYVFDENRNEILGQLNIDFENNQFVKDALTINFEQKKEKRLPVVARIEPEFAAGYAGAGELQVQPDSITISGPDVVLDTISSLYTKPVKLKKIKDDFSGSVDIDTSGYKDITLYTRQVNYSMDVEKYTEGNVLVPIEIINVPEGLEVVIFPKESLLFYQVSLKDYNKVTASDFRVVADFRKTREDQDFIIPEVVKKPEFTNNLRLNEKKIQFIIKK